jgi:hypothetical protein
MSIRHGVLRHAIVAAAAAALASCAAVVSEKPAFPNSAYATLPGMTGLYASGRTYILVENAGADGFRVLNFQDKGQHIVQVSYAEGHAIALGPEDFVLQSTCRASIDDKGKVKVEGDPAYTYYALLIGSRFKDSYWLSEGFPDEKLEKQFRLRRIDLGQEFSGMVLPKDISQSDAKAFFRADLNLMLSGSAPDLIRRNTDSEIASRVAAAARIVGGTEDCRKAAKAWRRQD